MAKNCVCMEVIGVPFQKKKCISCEPLCGMHLVYGNVRHLSRFVVEEVVYISYGRYICALNH